jgi:hypothetical protein
MGMIGVGAMIGAASFDPGGGIEAGYGPDLLTNYDFEDGATGWDTVLGTPVFSDGKVTFDDGGSRIEQSTTFFRGRTYEYEMELVDYSSGSVFVQFTGSTPTFGATRNANGTYTEQVTLAEDGKFTIRTSGGTTDLSIESIRFREVKPVYSAVTGSLTLTASWSDPSVDYDTLADALSASCAVLCVIDEDTEGVLMETGAQGRGTALYVSGGFVYFQTGNGDGSDSDTDRAVVTWQIPGGPAETRLIEWSASSVTNKAALYVNGQLIGTVQSFDVNKITGGNVGGTEKSHDVMVANPDGWTSDGDGALTGGSVTKCDVFLAQITSDVE